MDKNEFESLQKEYSQMITNIINSNAKFYRMNQKIKRKFGYDQNEGIFATCNKNTNVITININAVDSAIKNNEPLNIEYFILHEIRHIYQYLEIKDLNENYSNCNDIVMAKKRETEINNYISALDENGNENPKYFTQEIEIDAYAYAYSVMKYKYGLIEYLFIPHVYFKNTYFENLVSSWINVFKNEKL